MALRKYKTTPEARAYKRQKARKYRADPVVRARNAEACRRYRANQTPEQIQHRRDYANAYRLKNKEYFKEAESARRRDDPARQMVYAAKQRAAKRGIEFSIISHDVLPLPSHCPVLGIELDYKRGTWGPNSPSLDRVDNSRGYIPDNIVVVSFRANRLKSDATPDELRKLGEYYGGLKSVS